MAKITFYELEQFGMGNKKDYIKKQLKGHKVKFIDEKLTKENVEKAKDSDIIALFVHSQVDKKALCKLKKIKMIATMSTGYDHIEISECKKRKITVCSVPAYGSHTVAEHALALLLNISRKIVLSVERTRKGSFELEGLRGFDLQGKTIGIIGTGKIGKHVAQYCKALDMKVIAYDKYPDEEFACALGYEYVTFNKLLEKSDIITLHTPETKETHHMINTKNLKKIKKGAVLINTARGGLVETDALFKGMHEGVFSALGLDVLEQENCIKEEAELLHKDFPKKCDLKTLVEEHELLEMENVYVTPHNAFNSTEALMRIVDTTIDNIICFLEGVPKNVVKNKS